MNDVYEAVAARVGEPDSLSARALAAFVIAENLHAAPGSGVVALRVEERIIFPEDIELS